MPAISQKERVRRAAVKAGRQGICQSDFMPPTIDGGKPIARLAARVHELNEEGQWPLAPLGERDSFQVYVLRKYLSVPDLPVVAESVAETRDGTAWEGQPPPETLDDLMVKRETRCAIFDEDMAA